MRIKHIIVSNTAVLIAAFAVSCSKSEPTGQATQFQQLSSVPANMPMKDLGEIEFTGPTQKRISLGDGSDCVITPTLLANGNLEMNVALERKGDDGKVQLLAQSRLTAQSGQQCAISLGDKMVSLIPKLKTP